MPFRITHYTQNRDVQLLNSLIRKSKKLLVIIPVKPKKKHERKSAKIPKFRVTL